MKKKHLFLFLFLLISAVLTAQRTITKTYKSNTKAGQVYVLQNWGEYDGYNNCSKYFYISVPKSASYYISALCTMREDEKYKVYVDGTALEYMYPKHPGWQTAGITNQSVYLTPGKHTIRFAASGPMVPMVEEIFLYNYPPETGRAGVPETDGFFEKVNRLRQPSTVLAAPPAEDNSTGRVLPNPEGMYDHDVDASFMYSHFSWIYLTAGTHKFATANSNTLRTIAVFDPANFAYSWASSTGGPNGEADLRFVAPVAGFYALQLRPYPNTPGVAHIVYNGSLLVYEAIVGGRMYEMSQAYTGEINFFTTKLTRGDTRMMVSSYIATDIRGYNDDYTGGGGDWKWEYASRIKKDFGAQQIRYAYICAYSPTADGECDVYMGNGNSPVNQANYPEFPLLKPDDAILSSNTGYYNCIGWSGGMTQWIWPPSNYSLYNNCWNNGLACFDGFYGNQPARFPGAWTYTRTGATEANSVVDLWALLGSYTHGSVRKPGNDHPHGYDWESKPGGTPRTMHPRYALTNLNYAYGAVVNYYIPTGGYARNPAARPGEAQVAYATDADAVKAGVAVFEHAKLSTVSSSKLNQLVQRTDADITAKFNQLYEAWKKTWAVNAVYSDPAMYCRNEEHKAMEHFGLQHTRTVLPLIFDRYVNENDHLVGELMWTLTRNTYGKLLDDVKNEWRSNPNDAAGRYRIRSDHDNGVLYVEKILQQWQEQPQEQTLTETTTVVVSPNPVRDRLTVQLTLAKGARVSVKVISGQTRQSRMLQAETMLAAGQHRFNMDITGMAGASGDIIAIQVMVDGVVKTVKVLVTK